jgi:hypothetical protein
MHTGGPLPEHIVRKLEDALDRLNRDFERVEFWTAALKAFLQPIPSYVPTDSEFLLRRKNERQEDTARGFQRSSAAS